jgi:nitrogenase-stabilizing/protective protein
MTDEDFELDLDELSSAEEFLDYFGIEYDPAVVYVNRLHILQRFHDYLADVGDEPMTLGTRHNLYGDLLAAAYQDFVRSDARTEKVFRVFRMREPQQVAVPLSDLLEQRSSAAPV